MAMREIVSMWANTRMVVLAALTAALYAALLIPFKPIPIIPGFTELRPAVAWNTAEICTKPSFFAWLAKYV